VYDPVDGRCSRWVTIRVSSMCVPVFGVTVRPVARAGGGSAKADVSRAGRHVVFGAWMRRFHRDC